MHNYLGLLQHIRDNGIDKDDRTGVGTRSIFGAQFRHNLKKGFPLLTTKKMFFKGIKCELLWMLRGGDNINFLNDYGVHIWDAWTNEEGSLGPVYGVQWRMWTNGDKLEDQIQNVIDTLKTNPDSRRMVVSAWNPTELEEMALQPCHVLFQFYVANGALSCHMYQRSADVFLGVPFNIASYALLTHMMAQVTGYDVGDLIISFGDVHIYQNHFDQVDTQLKRTPKTLPQLWLNMTTKEIDDFRMEDIRIMNYHCHEPISAPVAV